MAIKNENRRTTAQALIQHTINRIDAKLEKIPLPIGSKERHFDFERIINENVIPALAGLIVERNGGYFDSGFTVDRTVTKGN